MDERNPGGGEGDMKKVEDLESLESMVHNNGDWKRGEEV